MAAVPTSVVPRFEYVVNGDLEIFIQVNFVGDTVSLGGVPAITYVDAYGNSKRARSAAPHISDPAKRVDHFWMRFDATVLWGSVSIIIPDDDPNVAIFVGGLGPGTSIAGGTYPVT